MKHVAQFLLCCLLAIPATAQRGGGMHGGGARGGGFHGAVGGGFHGGGNSGFRGGYGGFRGGYGGFSSYGGFRHGGFHHGFYGRNRFSFGLNYWPWVYGYPYYGSGYGGSYYPYYDPGYSYPSYDYGYQSPVVTYQNEPAQYYPQPPAPVHPETHEYPDNSTASTLRPAGESPIYLIAIKGQDNILAGVTYWVEGDSLQYVNLQHVQKHVPLDSIDRALSLRLNHERNMDFRLPPAP